MTRRNTGNRPAIGVATAAMLALGACGSSNTPARVPQDPPPRADPEPREPAPPPQPRDRTPAPETASARPSWFTDAPVQTPVGRWLVPGVADAPDLNQARTNALADARTRIARDVFADRGLSDDDFDETVRHSASARVSNGDFRFWVVLELKPTS